MRLHLHPIIKSRKQCPSSVYRVIAAEIRAQHRRLVASGDLTGSAHDACRNMLIAAGELEAAADENEKRTQ